MQLQHFLVWHSWAKGPCSLAGSFGVLTSGLQSSGTRDIPAAARGEGQLSLARGRIGNCWLTMVNVVQIVSAFCQSQFFFLEMMAHVRQQVPSMDWRRESYVSHLRRAMKCIVKSITVMCRRLIGRATRAFLQHGSCNR